MEKKSRKTKSGVHAVLLTVLALLLLPSGYWKLSAAGFMPVRNFPRELYEGGPQNWAIAQDSLGRIYVGNRDGLLSFDGERWTKHGLPNNSAVRSVFYDGTDGRIYVGGTAEFGYFAPAGASGGMIYTSLLGSFSDSRPQFTEVWNIFRDDGGKIWFQSDYHLIRYDGGRSEALESRTRITCSALIHRTIYVADNDGRIREYNGTRLVPTPGTGLLAGKKIMAFVPLREPDNFIIATSVDGLYRYDGTEAEAYGDSDINRFLADRQLFCAAANGRGDMAFGTVTGGIVVVNPENRRTSYLNKESGMQNNTVLGAAFDRAGNIWLGLDNGLDYAVYNSPLSNLVSPSTDVGAVYTTALDGARMYIGTNQGLYSAPYPFADSPHPLSLRRELQGQIWSLARSAESFLVAGDAGVYSRRSDGVFERIGGLTGAHYVHPLRGSADSAALASTYDGFHLLLRRGDRWTDGGRVDGDPAIGGYFVEDAHGYMWLNHWLNGVYRIRFNAEARRFDEFGLLSPAEGLPSVRINTVSTYGGRVVFVSDEGFYTYDYAQGRVVADEELQRRFPESIPQTLHNFADSAMVVIENDGIDIAAGSRESSFLRIKSLTKQLVNGYEHVNYIGPGEILLANQDGMWSIDPESADRYAGEPGPFVAAVYAGGDSLVYRAFSRDAVAAGGGDDELPALPYALNTLRFEFACPDYRSASGVRYSSYLEGYDKDWSAESADAVREFARLGEGRYVLRLRSRNLHSGVAGESSFRFHILPPWYRSTAAMLAYLLTALLAAYALYRLLVGWRRAAVSRVEQRKARELDDVRRRAEQEALRKDYEIATLKSAQLEDGIMHRSSELNSATMNLIRKNEMLNEIAARIGRIQASADMDKASAGLQRQLSAIQSSIEANIKHDDDWKAVSRNLDIVYESFTRALVERHPELTAGDIRMCCYIKMGLSSKEIASLISISVKSVEMARYRLRKKMGLGTEMSLSDYIARL